MNRSHTVLFAIEEARKGKPVLTISQMMEAVNNRGEPRYVSILKTTPLVGNKTLSVKGEARGEKGYPVTATFYNVDYSMEKDEAHPLTVRAEKGHQAYMEQIVESQHPVQVRCQCPDYRHTYAHWNKQQKALSGRAFPSYERKTTWMPERNPKHQPGICKHLIGLFERLRRDKIIAR